MIAFLSAVLNVSLMLFLLSNSGLGNLFESTGTYPNGPRKTSLTARDLNKLFQDDAC